MSAIYCYKLITTHCTGTVLGCIKNKKMLIRSKMYFHSIAYYPWKQTVCYAIGRKNAI